MDVKERNDIIELEDGGCLVQKAASATVQESEGTIVAMVSTPSVDSYGDVIVQGKNENGAGWVLDRFNGAPVMLWSHNMFQPNLAAPGTTAKVLPHEQFGEALYLDPVLFDPGDEFAVELEGKIRRGVIVENSVGFVSRKHEYIRDENDRITGLRFFEQELLELSWANRGANPDTTTMFRSMISNYPDIAKQVSSADNQRAAEEKAELLDAIRQVTDRVRTLEQLVTDQAANIKGLTGELASAQARAVLHAKKEQEDQIDALLRALGK